VISCSASSSWADSVRSLIQAPDKRASLRWGWLDFLGSVPSVLPLRLARLARLPRTWPVVRTRPLLQIVREYQRNRAQGVLLVTLFAVVMVLELEGRWPRG
jgi:voltage-gated potassium channel